MRESPARRPEAKRAGEDTPPARKGQNGLLRWRMPGYRVPGGSRQPPAATARAAKSAGTREAPPTSPPSISSLPKSSFAFAGVTDPP